MFITLFMFLMQQPAAYCKCQQAASILIKRGIIDTSALTKNDEQNCYVRPIVILHCHLLCFISILEYRPIGAYYISL